MMRFQTKTTGAFCKLEVLDTNGELRLAQTALYAGGHHELGIVFVEQEHEWDSKRCNRRNGITLVVVPFVFGWESS